MTDPRETAGFVMFLGLIGLLVIFGISLLPRGGTFVEIARCVERCEAAGMEVDEISTGWGWHKNVRCMCTKTTPLDAGRN